ncbi:SagB family peptide dehydrogenase [Cohnella caldifontis]|uniref:SagB family peptide dehydrogenase n=1 Tax=Cohnella caldifontis TaxID=3027471 RepID=UPI0023EB09F2|nr:SagB family peptide dehydrogenase [Cohnella sp. YIM B05605]
MDKELLRFVTELHFETDKAKPHDWEADWEDAPLPYKLYRGVPAFDLAADFPLTLEDSPAGGQPAARSLGYFLGYAYGIAQISRSVPLSGEQAEIALGRRVVPSGGGLYPNELYVYLKLPDLPRGVFHYDAAHHRLLLLREGDFDDVLEQALGERCDLSACFGAVFVSAVFWKNFFKYYHFSYRLQGLDAGVLLGQLLESGKRFGYGAVVCYQYLDRVIGRLLGLNEGEESVYAVVLLTDSLGRKVRKSGSETRRAGAEELLRQLPELNHAHYVRSRRIREYPMLLRMDAASRIESAEAFRLREFNREDPGGFPLIRLPETSPRPCDLAVLARRRYSPETDFVLKPIGLPSLAELLRQTLDDARYRNDLARSDEETGPLAELVFCAYGAEGLENGAYRYDGEAHALRLIRQGDHRAWLQYATTFPNVNLSQVPLCFHVTGDREHGCPGFGPRGYRIQQMEAGMLLQRLLLRAAAAGWGGRPLLSYEAEAIDDLYRLPARGDTALIQVPVGPYRYRARWEGGLFR